MATKNTNDAPTLAQVRRAASAATRALEKRDALIRAAVAAGASRREVADATGLGTMTVHRIATRDESEATS